MPAAWAVGGRHQSWTASWLVRVFYLRECVARQSRRWLHCANHRWMGSSPHQQLLPHSLVSGRAAACQIMSRETSTSRRKPQNERRFDSRPELSTSSKAEMVRKQCGQCNLSRQLDTRKIVNLPGNQFSGDDAAFTATEYRKSIRLVRRVAGDFRPNNETMLYRRQATRWTLEG